MAGLGTGCWTSLEELRRLPRDSEIVQPDPTVSYETSYAEWVKAIDFLIAAYGRTRR